MKARYRDRYDAGRELALLLGAYARRSNVLVLALPRGGVPVAYEVAKALAAPLDVFVVRKLGVPGHEELAMGAIATGDIIVLNDDVITNLVIPRRVIEAVVAAERQELEKRERLYRNDRQPPGVQGRTVILVDDGLATGSTMRAAIAALRLQGPERIVVAVPVAARQTCDQLSSEVDEVVCTLTPESFYAVGLWYDDFSPTTDQEVRELLERNRQKMGDGQDQRSNGESAPGVAAGGIESGGGA
jgi:predicted phosphoribosyltransferase